MRRDLTDQYILTGRLASLKTIDNQPCSDDSAVLTRPYRSDWSWGKGQRQGREALSTVRMTAAGHVALVCGVEDGQTLIPAGRSGSVGLQP